MGVFNRIWYRRNIFRIISKIHIMIIKRTLMKMINMDNKLELTAASIILFGVSFGSILIFIHLRSL